jgi:signal transduction histidine kinase
LIGAVQEAPADNIMLDRTVLAVPPEDVYEIRDSSGTLLARSANWQGAQLPSPHGAAPGDAEPTNDAHAFHPGDRTYRTRIHGRSYRLLVRQGLRVVDPADNGGGVPHRFLVVYGAPVDQVWREVQEAVAFYAISSIALLVITALLMAWRLHRGLAPLRQLAAEAEAISVQRWSFQPPQSAVETRELAPLASALAAALERLQGSFAQQRRFISDAAHELKTAVAVVKSSLQLLNMRQRTPAEYEAGVEASLDDCQRMEEIVARMLLLARVENLEPASAEVTATDLSACVATTVQQLHTVAELRGVDVVSDAQPAISVSLGAEECSLVCSNLLLNALQHSVAHTQVRVSLAVCEGMAEFRVVDQGEGIEPELLPHVFERFSRGDPSRTRNTGGTGLGLAICKAIVDRCGGSIRLQSEPARGTTAIVRLPLAAKPVQRSAEQPEPLHARSL